MRWASTGIHIHLQRGSRLERRKLKIQLLSVKLRAEALECCVRVLKFNADSTRSWPKTSQITSSCYLGTTRMEGNNTVPVPQGRPVTSLTWDWIKFSCLWLKPQIKCYTHTTALRPRCEMSLRARRVHWTKLTHNGTSHFTPWQGHTVGTHLLASPARRGALECDCILDILKRKIRKLNTFPDQMDLCMKP